MGEPRSIQCVVCSKTLISMDLAGNEDFDMVDGGIVGEIRAPYGSIHDSALLQVGLCDDCVSSGLASGRVILLEEGL